MAALAAVSADSLRRYPDPVFADLRAALAELNGTVPERVFVGNGSDEVLAVAAKTFVEDDEAIGSLDPSYSLYKTLAAIRNVAFVPTPLGKGFAWNGRIAQGATAKTALFLLTNPNAPTGVFVPVEQIAAELGISRVHLSRKLKALNAASPSDMIKSRRMDAAAAMLRSGERNMTVVAASCGFASAAYFSSAFKAFYGVSPSAFE